MIKVTFTEEQFVDMMMKYWEYGGNEPYKDWADNEGRLFINEWLESNNWTTDGLFSKEFTYYMIEKYVEFKERTLN